MEISLEHKQQDYVVEPPTQMPLRTLQIMISGPSRVHWQTNSSWPSFTQTEDEVLVESIKKENKNKKLRKRERQGAKEETVT
jgi:hypothetical protein